MKKNDNTIFWILGLGGLVYAGYKMFFAGKGQKRDGSSIQVPDVNPKTGEKYSDYDKAVMTLQTLLGVGVDAIVGPQTTAQLKEFYLGNLSYGDISPLNVEKYISEVKNKTTPYNQKMKAEAMADANANSEKKVVSIISAYNDSKTQVINLNQEKSVNGLFQVYEVVFNSASKDWERVGVQNIAAGRKTRDGALPYSYSPKWNALIMRYNKSGKYVYVAINPDFVQVIM
jgi:hypothetical protein